MNIVDMKSREIAERRVENVSVGLTTIQGFELAQRAAKLLASSTLVPDRYRGNIADCVVALNMAQRMGSDPLMTMQNLYVVHGTPAWSAQMLISVWNQCGRYTSIRYAFEGEKGADSWGCKALSVERETKEVIEGALITIGMSKAEGWFGKNGSKWKTMPEQMLRYRAAAWLVRAYAPELAMGFQTVEEVHDVYDAVPGKDGAFSVSDLKVSEEDDEQGRQSSGLSEAFSEAYEPTSKPEPEPEPHADWPRRDGDGWIDSRGFPFDARIHALGAHGVPSVIGSGAFRRKRGVADALFDRVEAELRSGLEAKNAPAADAIEDSAAGPSASDISLAIRRCTSLDDCDDAEDMLRDCCADEATMTNLNNALEDRRARVARLEGEVPVAD